MILRHNLHKYLRYKLCRLSLRVAVDRPKNLLLFRWLHADGLERLPGAAVRTDEGFVVLPGKRRSAVIRPTTKRADRRPYDM